MIHTVLKGRLTIPEAIHGKSAYEIALLYGFEGSEEEWIRSLSQDAVEKAAQVLEEKGTQILSDLEGASVQAKELFETTGYVGKLKFTDDSEGNVTAFVTGTGQIALREDSEGNLNLEVI